MLRYESLERIERKPGSRDYSLEEILSIPSELKSDADLFQIQVDLMNLGSGAGTTQYILELEQVMKDSARLDINKIATLRTNQLLLKMQKEKLETLITKTSDKAKLQKLEEFKFFYEDAIRRIDVLKKFDTSGQRPNEETMYQVIYDAPPAQPSNTSVVAPANKNSAYTLNGNQPNPDAKKIREAATIIENALYAGETTICHSNARERKAFAMELAKKHYQNCTYTNVELFTAIYKYSFDHSGFFSNSSMLGTFIFWSSTLNNGYPKIDPTTARAKKHMAEKPESRTALICQALGYKLERPKNQLDIAFRGKQR